LAKSINDGSKWAVFSPENMPEREFYKDLIHTYIGKSPESFHENRMSRQELEKGMSFIKEHFFLIVPQNDIPTPDYIHNRFREFIIKLNVCGCIIDPYNQLDNDLLKFGGREDQYLSAFLSKSKRFAIENDVYYVIITHPKSGLKKGNTGDYEMPNVFDLSGGAMWNNKMDNILLTHRPFYTSCNENTTVMFGSQKIKKQKLNGVPGMVELKFDRFKNRFYEQDNKSPIELENPVLPEPTEQKKDIITDYSRELLNTTNDEFYEQKEEAPF
jgi:hypothetical protein